MNDNYSITFRIGFFLEQNCYSHHWAPLLLRLRLREGELRVYGGCAANIQFHSTLHKFDGDEGNVLTSS